MSMSSYDITNESTENTLDSAEDLQDAIRIAREAARHGQTGDPITIIESEGKSIMQFSLLSNGKIAEQTIA